MAVITRWSHKRGGGKAGFHFTFKNDFFTSIFWGHNRLTLLKLHYSTSEVVVEVEVEVEVVDNSNLTTPLRE